MPKLVKYFIVLIGIGVYGVMVYVFILRVEFLNNSVQVAGTVVKLKKASYGSGGSLAYTDSGSSLVYEPVVEFKTVDGKVIRFVSGSGSNPPAFAVGEKVMVRYLPSHPYMAEINQFWELWGGVLFCGLFGTAIIVFGLGVFNVTSFRKLSRYVKLKLSASKVSPHSHQLKGSEPFKK